MGAIAPSRQSTVRRLARARLPELSGQMVAATVVRATDSPTITA